MSTTSTTTVSTIKKRNVLSRNLEHLKAGVAVGFSLSGIGVVIAGIVMHVINPAFGFLTIPLALQALLVAVIKKAPKTVELLKETMRDVLKNEDPQKVNNFVDEMVSVFTQNTARTNNEPIADVEGDPSVVTPPQMVQSSRGIQPQKAKVVQPRVPMNAYYFPNEDRYELTPRVPT